LSVFDIYINRMWFVISENPSLGIQELAAKSRRCWETKEKTQQIQGWTKCNLLGTLNSRKTGGPLLPKAGGRALYAKLDKDGHWPANMCLAFLKNY
jgi:hypothetical protein